MGESGLLSFSDVYDAIKQRDQNMIFLETPNESHSYHDLIQRISKLPVGIKFNKSMTAFDQIAWMFRTRLDGDTICLCDYTPTTEDKLLGAEIILNTSGTHLQKHVMLKEETIFRNLESALKRVDIGSDDRIFCFVPFDHILGLECGLMTSLVRGCRIQVPISPISAISDLRRMKPTCVVGIPSIVDLLDGCDGIKKLLIGGTPLGNAHMPPGCKVAFGYGLTECLLVSIGGPDGDDCGFPLDGQTVEVNDDEIQVSGDVMIGYASSKPLIGPFRTGDLGYITDGRLHVTGRKDRTFVFDDGYKVNTDEIESIMRENPSVIECSSTVSKGRIFLKVVCNHDRRIDDTINRLNNIIAPHVIDDVEVIVRE